MAGTCARNCIRLHRREPPRDLTGISQVQVCQKHNQRQRVQFCWKRSVTPHADLSHKRLVLKRLPEHMQVMDLADGGPAWLVDLDAASSVRLRFSGDSFAALLSRVPSKESIEGSSGSAGGVFPEREQSLPEDVAVAERGSQRRQTADSLYGFALVSCAVSQSPTRCAKQWRPDYNKLRSHAVAAKQPEVYWLAAIRLGCAALGWPNKNVRRQKAI